MKPTLEWCNAAVVELSRGSDESAVLGGGSRPEQAKTYMITPSRMSSPVETGSLRSQLVTSQVDIVCYSLQRQDGQITSAAAEVWARVDEQVERVHQLGALGLREIIQAAPVACDFQIAEPSEPWFIAATVSLELLYKRALVLGA